MNSPRARRLAADYHAVSKLCQESTILDLSCSGDPPNTYVLKFSGSGLALDPQSGPYPQEVHEVRVRLGANYPRSIPELHWLSPIFHPNISANGLVCLGGYTTNWVPSLKLDDLCIMLWDMIRYRNFDSTSPYNRMAAEWAKTQRQYILPLDDRPLRNKPMVASKPSVSSPSPPAAPSVPPPVPPAETLSSSDVVELGPEDVEVIPLDEHEFSGGPGGLNPPAATPPPVGRRAEEDTGITFL